MINEFFSVIQLLATLAIGFVILGYSEYFIKTLINFFRADEAIVDAELECRKLIPDKDTRDNLKSAKLGNGNTLKSIEELRIDCVEMEGKVDEFVTKAKIELGKKSKVCSLVSLSLFVFMTTVVLLFIPCLPQLWPEFSKYIPYILVSFPIPCILYMVLGWFFGEKDNKAKILKFGSLRHPIIWFFVFCILSGAYAFVAQWQSFDIGTSWKFMFVALIIVCWFNFPMYAIFIKRSMNQFKAKVEELMAPIVKECNDKNLKGRCNDLITVKKMEELTNKNTPQPANNPTPQPANNPTPQPANNPTPQLANHPTPQPANNPTPQLANHPTPQPANNPTPQLANNPTPQPANNPTPQAKRHDHSGSRGHKRH